VLALTATNTVLAGYAIHQRNHAIKVAMSHKKSKKPKKDKS
jgi:hypothetical protein